MIVIDFAQYMLVNKQQCNYSVYIIALNRSPNMQTAHNNNKNMAAKCPNVWNQIVTVDDARADDVDADSDGDSDIMDMDTSIPTAFEEGVSMMKSLKMSTGKHFILRTWKK